MKQFNIFGAIVDSEMDKYDRSDLTLKDFNDFAETIEDNEEVEFVFNSPGGSVTTGIAIANKIKSLSNRGVKTIALIEGVCASISTCIACACDKVIMSEGSFLMIHNCWSVVQGDCNTLRKEADLMEKMNEAILSFYRSKFNATDEQLKQWMNDETWIGSMDAKDFGFNCEVVEGGEFKMAASMDRYNFKHIPEVLNMKKNEEEKKEEVEVSSEEEKTTEVVEPTENVETQEEVETTEKVEETPVEPTEEVEEEKKDEEVEEEVKDEDETPSEDDNEEKDEDEETIEELKSRIAELEKENEELKNKIAECEKPVEDRLAGLQSSLQKNFNAKINDFTNQLKMKDEELKSAQNDLISLKDNLEKTTKELTSAKDELDKTSSALVEKTNALNSLNSKVLAKPEEVVDWRNLRGKEFWNFLKQHPEIINNK